MKQAEERTVSDFLSRLPDDPKKVVFGLLAQRSWDSPLRALAQVSKATREEVGKLLGIATQEAYAEEMLHCEAVLAEEVQGNLLPAATPAPAQKEIAAMQLAGNLLVVDQARLRRDFNTTGKILESAGRLETCNGFKGISIPLASVALNEALKSDLSALRNKVIKLDARGLDRDRFMNEVLPLLSLIDPGCQVVLNADGVGLNRDDLAALVTALHDNPVVHRLDVSNNLLCIHRQATVALAALLAMPGPLSHLYLENVGFNDETALCLAKPLAHNPCLQHLSVDDNPLLTIKGRLRLIDSVARVERGELVHFNPVIQVLRLELGDGQGLIDDPEELNVLQAAHSANFRITLHVNKF